MKDYSRYFFHLMILILIIFFVLYFPKLKLEQTMQRIDYYDHVNLINAHQIEQWQKGKWSDWQRVFVIESKIKGRVAVVSLNGFERFARLIQKIFCVDYFEKFFHAKDVQVLSPSQLKQSDQKVSELSRSTLDINQKDQETAPKTPEEADKKEEQDVKSNLLLNDASSHEIQKEPVKQDNPETSNLNNVASSEIQSAQAEVVPEEKIADEDMKRIINHGVLEERFFDISNFERLLPAFEDFKLDEQTQRGFGNHDITQSIFIDVTSFRHRMNDKHMQLFIRYLTMKGKIFGFCDAYNNGYRLFFTDPGMPLFTKEKLREIDEHIKNLHLPQVNEFAREEKETIEKVLKHIKREHFNRISSNIPLFVVEMYDIQLIKMRQDKSEKVLDELVKRGIIFSWNAYNDSHTVCIKLSNADQLRLSRQSINHYIWDEWRDRELIERQATFKQANQIVLSENHKNELEALFNQEYNHSALKEDLKDLLEKLNQRVKPGFYDWKPRRLYNDKVLKALKERGYINDYIEEYLNMQFKIYVKPEDKGNEVV